MKKVVALTIALLFASLIIAPTSVMAECRNFPEDHDCGEKPNDTCTTTNGRGSGTAYYSYNAYDYKCNKNPGYYFHNYECDTPCSGTGGPGTWTCFAAGTKVGMSTGSEKNIEEVKVGDKVVSQDEAGNRSVSTVTKLDQPIREHMCRVDFAGQKIPPLQMTAEHPLMTSDGWKSITPSKTAEENPNLIVEALQKGDKVVREEGGTSEIENISCWSKSTPAYNLILDGTAHTYFADGYLAHNKGGVEWPTCATNTALTCTTGAYDVRSCDDWRQPGCASRWPSKFSPGGCGTDWSCQTSCACCSAGTTLECSPTTYTYGYRSTLYHTNNQGDLIGDSSHSM